MCEADYALVSDIPPVHSETPSTMSADTREWIANPCSPNHQTMAPDAKTTTTIDEKYFEAGVQFLEGGKLWMVVKVDDYTPADEDKTYKCVYYYGVRANPDGAPPLEECEFTPIEELIELVQETMKKKLLRDEKRAAATPPKPPKAAAAFDASEEEKLPLSAFRAYRKGLRRIEADTGLTPQQRDTKISHLRKQFGMSTMKKVRK